MTAPPPHLDDHVVIRLSPDDAADLQDLHERCSDYYRIVEGGPTRPTSAEEDLLEVPPGKTLADKFLFGIRADDGGLVGALELARDLPAEGTWWIALLMLDPRARGRGLGTRILAAAAEWVAAQGGRELQLAVLTQNAPAERFWRRRGFAELRRVPFTAATGYVSEAIIMSRATEPRGGA
jgi:GNAT superfamily N-acetyltransferase